MPGMPTSSGGAGRWAEWSPDGRGGGLALRRMGETLAGDNLTIEPSVGRPCTSECHLQAIQNAHIKDRSPQTAGARA